MRLGQLARKLALRPTEIVEFLAENQIQIGDGANIRLDDDQVTLIMKKFVPGWEETKEEEVEAIEEVLAETNLATKEENEEDKEQVSDEIGNPELTAPAENIEVIKAPKVELAGLKVLGKIELPEPKKNEATPEPETVEPAAPVPEVERKNFRGERKKIDDKRRRDYRSEKNPVALQREKEAKEEQRKRDEQIARDKERKTQNYLKKVKTPPAMKAVRMVKEPVMQMTEKELEEAPKTLWGKIVRWLTTVS